MLSRGETCSRLPCLEKHPDWELGGDLYRRVYPVVAPVDVVYSQGVLALLLKVINLPCGRLVLALRGRHELAAPLQHDVISNSLDRSVRD